MRIRVFPLIIWMALFSLLLPVSQGFSGFREGMKIRPGYKAGLGEILAETVLVQGKVYIVHAKAYEAYRAKGSLPLFKGDGITTLKKGRIRIELNDGSLITMASESDLVISRSLFDPGKKSRSSFINMSAGKVRFFVKKFLDYRQTEFRVKTKTAILGVRGSDFIVTATERSTEVVTLGDTELTVLSLATPDLPPVVLTDFERTVVEMGEAPGEVEEVARELIETMTEDMGITPRGPEVELREREKLKKRAPAVYKSPEGIRVPSEDIVKPELKDIPEGIETLPRHEIPSGENLKEQVESVKGEQEDILEEKHGEIIEKETKEEAPDFPDKPY